MRRSRRRNDRRQARFKPGTHRARNCQRPEPVFGGIAATGAIARTATNIKCGGRTPVAGIVHSANACWQSSFWRRRSPKFIPLATLSAVLVNVALNMGEWHNFSRLTKWPQSDSAVFLDDIHIDSTDRPDRRGGSRNGPGGDACSSSGCRKQRKSPRSMKAPRTEGPHQSLEGPKNSKRRVGLPDFRIILFGRSRQVGKCAQAGRPGAGRFDFAHEKSSGDGRHRTQRPRGPP